MTTPSLVILDMAGTTVEDNGQVPHAFASALAANGLTVSDDDITRVRGASKREAIRQLLPRLREDASARQALDFDAEADQSFDSDQDVDQRGVSAPPDVVVSKRSACDSGRC